MHVCRQSFWRTLQLPNMPPYLSNKQKIGIVLALTLTMEPRTKHNKKKRLWTKHQHLNKEQLYQMSVIRELDNQEFRRCLRMDTNNFDMLLNLVRPLITKQDTLMRQAVSAEDRLLVTLKYLALGKDYTDLAYSSGISVQLISKLVPETCEAICKVLKNYLKLPETENEWLKIAEQYQKKWQFNHCVGSVGARHILVIKPKQRASQYYNYSGTFSVLLFAVVNADFEFLYIHAGTEGGLPVEVPILECRFFYKKIIEEELDLPEASVLPKSKSSAPYVFLGDTGFGLDKYILEPYPQENITQKMRVFNYRLSRATKVIENVFGILASRFRVFQQNIRVDIQNVDKIIMASCYLHNYLLKTSPNYITSVDHEEIANGTFQEGLWREQNALLCLQKGNEEETRDDSIVKNVFKDYFNGPGRVRVSK